MVNPALALQQGMMNAQALRDQADAAERLRREDQQLALDRDRQNAARAAMIERYGVMAGDPVMLGQLEGIDQRRQGFDRGVEAEDAERRRQAIMNASGLYQQALSRGASPQEAAASVSRVMPLIAPNEQVANDAIGILQANPEQAESVFRSLAGEGIAEPEFGAADFYEVDGQEVFGRPVQQPDGSVAFEPLPFQASREGFVQFQDPDFPGALFERNVQTGAVRQIAAAREAGDDDATTGPYRADEMADAFDSAAQRQRLIDDTFDTAIRQAGGWSAGLMSLTEIVPGTPAANLQATLQTLQATIAFGELERMKEQAQAAGSRGSGLGQVTEREIALLQSVLGNIENAQNPAQLRANLRRAQQEIAASHERVRRAYERFLRDNPQAAARQAPTGQNQDLPAVPEGVDPGDWEYMTAEERALWQ